MSIYTIQGQDVEFDPFDVEAYERYESQLEQMRKIKEEIPTGSAAAGMRFLCHALTMWQAKEPLSTCLENART